MIRKSPELIGIDLDWAVARCEDLHTGYPGYWSNSVITAGENGTENPFAYSTNWAISGPIIERENVALFPHGDGVYEAEAFLNPIRCAGPTPLVAAMRAYVTSKLGHEIEVPDGL